MTTKRHIELCDTVTAKDTRGAVVCKIELAEDGLAPDNLMLFPASDVDGELKTRDGRKFRLPSPQKLADSFNAEGFKVPFDFDHEVEMGGSPAIGWIKGLYVQDGAVFANVKWLKAGREAIESEEYAYVSPAFMVDWDVGEIKGLTSAALTNRPAFKLAALTSANNGDIMNPELMKLLGLNDKSTPEQIAEAIKAHQAKLAEADAAKVALEAANAKHKAELAAAQAAATPSLANFVPRADFDAAVARTAALELASKQKEEAAHKAQVEAEIDAAQKAGKFAPASRDFYVQACSTPAGLEAFRKFVHGAPVIAPDNVVTAAAKAPVGTEVVLTSTDLEVIKTKGMSAEAFLAAKKELATH